MFLFEWFQRGGPVMWGLLTCSIVAFGIACERVFFWYMERKRIDPEQLQKFFGSIHRNDNSQARELAEEFDNPLLDILVGIWDREGPQAMLEALDLQLNQIEERAQRYLYGLKTIVSISPLLGILGTVIGIIQSFDVMGSAGAAANPQAVGAGLAEALITTAFGLMIAVPGLIAHNYFLSRARSYINQLDEYADELAFHLSQNGEDQSSAHVEIEREEREASIS